MELQRQGSIMTIGATWRWSLRVLLRNLSTHLHVAIDVLEASPLQVLIVSINWLKAAQ
jgi:hypothetical protein